MSAAAPFDQMTPAGGGRVTAVLGPTNTGKTHYALERMLAHRSGMIGLPLRLLAREIYDRIVAKRGAKDVALVTGEEKIIPAGARYWVATVEAMPLEREVEFLAIDEIQLAADPERGRVFTSRLLHARGLEETLFLGSDTMRPILQRLFRDIQFLSRERFSTLAYTGPRKVTRLPRRTAIVAFSADTVYAIAELIRRQRGGAAVVLGALSPRTRNAQAELYQSGHVDFLIATDAIGMGLNMDIDHAAFAAQRKFDGRRPRNLTASELAQIAGRAGRHVRDGSFGVTGDCPPLDEDIVAAIENHEFDPVAALQWRTEKIDLASLPALMRSLDTPPPRREFIRSRREDDEEALARLAAQDEIRDIAKGGAALATLWDICQIPDFRKLGADQHARLLADLYLILMGKGRIDDDWLATRINRLERTDGDIDALSSRIAHVRSWTFLSHRAAWLQNAAYWQERTRAIEDSLSDALHEKLTQRFVDRRTSTLLKRMKDDAPLLAGVTDDGEVIVEGQFIGRLLGFEFIVDPRASGVEAKSLRAAGEKALRPVLAARAAALANAAPDELTLTDDGAVQWRSALVARLQKGPAPLRPDLAISGLDDITPNMRARVEDRLKDFVAAKIEGALAPLIALQTAANTEGEDALKGLTKGVAYRLVENFGATSRAQFGDDLKQLEQDERAKMRKLGVRFGEYTLHMPALLKPAPARLLTLIWALWAERRPGDTPPPKAGLVSIEVNESLPHAYYYAAGYRPSGARAVRIDMLERLAGLIRTARNEADMREGFAATPQMMSLVGCSGEDFEGVLRSLGLRKNIVKKKPQPPKPATEATPDNAKTDGAQPAKAGSMEPGAPPSDAPANTDAIAAAEPAAQEATPETAAVPAEHEATPPPEPADAMAADAVAAEATAGTETGPAETEQAQPLDSEAKAETEAVAEAAAPMAEADASAPGTEPEAPPEEIEVVLWRPAPRKPPQRHQQRHGDGRSKDGRPGNRSRGDQHGHKGKHGKTQRFDKSSGKGQKQGGGKRRPPREKQPDPNSPFAVLAALKSEMTGDKDPSKKEPEKAE